MKKRSPFRKAKAGETESDLGIKSPGLQGFFDHYRKLEEVYKERRHKAFRGLFKDIEIQGNQYLLISLILTSIANIVSLTADLAFFRIDLTPLPTLFFLFMSVLIGAASGAIFSGILIDIIKKKLTLIQILLIVASVNLVLEINLIHQSVMIINFILICITSFIVSVLFIIQTTLFLEYSSILGRGRILSFIYIEMIVFLLVFGVMTQIGIQYFPLLLYSPLIFLVFTFLFINKEKLLENSPEIRINIEEKHINLEFIQVVVFIFFFCFTIGLTTPIYEMKNSFFAIFSEQLSSPALYLAFLFMFIFSALAAIIIGSIFDFKGRIITISSLMLVITFVNFLGLFEIPGLFLREAIIISLYVAGVMTISLLIGDITKKKNYSKTFTFSISVGILGLLLGLQIVIFLKSLANAATQSNMMLLGIQYLTSVITLLLLMHSKEALPHKEKEWFESLIHLYIVHKSGLLLYEHEFIEVDQKTESDLVSGGIIGVTTILEEIVRGREKLNIIDHGDKKLMFKYSPQKDVIFVLLIGEDLFVLRNKLDQFIAEFVEQYQEKVDNLHGVVASQWIGISSLIQKYFERKYFEIPLERRHRHFSQ